MPFIKPALTQRTLQSPSYITKITLRPQDVSLSRLFSKNTGKDFEVHFAVMIIPRGNLNPGIALSPNNINLVSLRSSIISNIRPQDKKYMVLSNFDTRKAIFKFNHILWLKDATAGLRPDTDISRFRRVFSFKVAPPPMLLTDYVSKPIEEFILKQFINWLEKGRKEAKYFKYLIPDNFRQNVRQRLRNMFDWEYDKQWNRVTSVLKPVYILALLYATGQAINNYKELRKADITGSKEKMFVDKVRRNITKFDRSKWEKFSNKRFM